ncbi:MAG: hypothetical protein AAF206_13095, partial [Bacteroidota bacterium]
MQKLLFHLSLLSEEQQKDFQYFVQSPYFNRRKDLSLLLTLLQEEKTAARGETGIYEVWKGKRVFDQNIIRKAFSALNALLHQFLGQEMYRIKPELRLQHQLEGLNDISAHQYFAGFYQKGERILGNSLLQDRSFHIRANIIDAHTTYLNFQAERGYVPNFDQATHLIDQDFLLRRLKYALAQQSHSQSLHAQSIQSLSIAPLLRELRERPEDWHPMLHAYDRLMRLYQGEDAARHYPALKELILHQLDDVFDAEVREIMTASINFAAARMRSGEQQYVDEFEGLYQIMIDRKLLWYNGIIFTWHVKNLVGYYLNKRNFDWVKNFLADNSQYFIPAQRQQLEHYCHGLIFYFQQSYKQANHEFEQLLTRFDDVFYGLDIRVAKARLLYET